MLRLNDAVVIVARPADNDVWDVPTRLIGQVAIVVDIREDCIRIRLAANGDSWNFPLDYRGVLAPVNQNKWNTLGYISPFKPLNLP